jgi:ATP-dependent DNA helicase MPH1
MSGDEGDSMFEDDDEELELLMEGLVGVNVLGGATSGTTLNGASIPKRSVSSDNYRESEGGVISTGPEESIVSRGSELSNRSSNPSSSGTSSRYKRQRTLDGLVASDSQPQYEEIPIVENINIPTHHKVDYNHLSKYIYPTNFEVRDYQYNLVQRAFYDNLLVALPTGLGKTFIASTVMLNFLRWFPNSKIIFMAPTRPLVAQQIKACCEITGIPASQVAILLDKTRKNRGEIWDSKKVFFTTPQVVENDLASGIVDPKSIVLLVIDEAHRARGNYAYNNVVKFLKRFNNSFRVLALTATPAADVDGVQEIIDNLAISKVEVRTERSIDIFRYMKHKKVERRFLAQSAEIVECIELLCTAIEPVLKLANERHIYEMRDPLKINFFQCMEASQRLVMNSSIPEGLKWSNFFILQLLGVVGQCFRRLNIYGIKSFYSYFSEKRLEFTTKWKKKKSTNKLNSEFYFHQSIEQLMKRAEEFLKDTNVVSHPKIEALMEELDDFFTTNTNPDSKVIIFTEFRESALEIVQSIERAGDKLKPHIFIGQSKEKDKFDEVKFAQKYSKKKKAKVAKYDVPQNIPSTRTSSEDAQIKGMNQKLQKEIIKKFKAGTYNILVATSIGEEGLDIGEVDLIVCYDSTSSPIKNIQRMGRTGRKRDGKVLLLFSSNEESKFDKAMDGYEYIQQHIMKGNLITLAPRNRIVPQDFTPSIEMKLIEIPEENIEIKTLDDEDEIIRFATQYMTGGKKTKAATKAEKTRAAKKGKKFFMPDNVETGFRSVTSMIREVGEKKSLQEKKKEKDYLDQMVDSDSDDDLSMYDYSTETVPTSRHVALMDLSKDDSLEISSNTIEVLEHPSDPAPPKKKTLGMRNSRVPAMAITQDPASSGEMQTPEPILSENEEEQSAKKALIQEPMPTMDLDDLDLPQYTIAAKSQQMQNDGRLRNSTLEHEDGFQKEVGHMNEVQNQNEGGFQKDFKPQDDERTTDESRNNQDLEDLFEEPDDNDLFDDGLDEELALLSGEHISSSEGDPIMKHHFDETEGFLNQQESMELYTSYYFPLDPNQINIPINPSMGIHKLHDDEIIAYKGKVGHSKTTQNLINYTNLVQTISTTVPKYSTINTLQDYCLQELKYIVIDDETNL